jgi:hypothetical protein
MTATLFGASGVHAQDGGSGVNDDTASDLGYTRVDVAVLYYQEDGGRVKATEPVASVTFNATDGDILRLKLTSDTLTGATPNGAAPWNEEQTFITPVHTQGVQATTTSASGRSVLVTIPGTDIAARQYTAPANALPLDYGFRDQRYAIDMGYSTLLDSDTRASVGTAFSTEHDYRSISFNTGLSKDFFDKNTTLSAAINLELDSSKPFFGTPESLSVMSGEAKDGKGHKRVIDAVFGATQVMNRYWLAQINYSIGTANGYLTDPYRIISVVDATTGGPVQYLYESRPRSRLRQSIYFGNKVAIGPTVADISARLYHDSWGIDSLTAEVAERVPITNALYVEPHVRYYTQSAADFFHDYLVNGEPLPDYASSDSRLGKFHATTIGVKIGLKVAHRGELYLRADRYNQSGESHPAGAIGELANQDLFTGADATSVMAGYTFAFY